jgi:hypothetical protein
VVAIRSLSLLTEAAAATVDSGESAEQKGYDEMGNRFQDLEHKMLGEDGFAYVLAGVSRIEEAFGLADLGVVTGARPWYRSRGPQVALPARARI